MPVSSVEPRTCARSVVPDSPSRLYLSQHMEMNKDLAEVSRPSTGNEDSNTDKQTLSVVL